MSLTGRREEWIEKFRLSSEKISPLWRYTRVCKDNYIYSRTFVAWDFLYSKMIGVPSSLLILTLWALTKITRCHSNVEFVQVFVHGRCSAEPGQKSNMPERALIAYCRSSTVVCIVLTMAVHLITIRQYFSLARAPDKTSIEIHAVRHPIHCHLYLGDDYHLGKSRFSYHFRSELGRLQSETVWRNSGEKCKGNRFAYVVARHLLCTCEEGRREGNQFYELGTVS